MIHAHSIAELNHSTWRIIARRVRNGSGEDWNHLFAPVEKARFDAMCEAGTAFKITGGCEGARVLLGGLARRRVG